MDSPAARIISIVKAGTDVKYRLNDARAKMENVVPTVVKITCIDAEKLVGGGRPFLSLVRYERMSTQPLMTSIVTLGLKIALLPTQTPTI